MNISFNINVVADQLDTDRFDSLGEGMTRRFISRGENTRPDGSIFVSPESQLSFGTRIKNAESLTHEIETRVDELIAAISSLNMDQNFSVFINVAAYHQDEQHIDISLGRELIEKLNNFEIEVDIEIYRFCPW